jgi:hypothetical protein
LQFRRNLAAKPRIVAATVAVLTRPFVIASTLLGDGTPPLAVCLATVARIVPIAMATTIKRREIEGWVATVSRLKPPRLCTTFANAGRVAFCKAPKAATRLPWRGHHAGLSTYHAEMILGCVAYTQRGADE